MEATYWHYLVPALIIVLYALFLYLGRLPHMESIQKFATMLDSKGGNILVLVSLALYFFHDAQVMYYVMIDKIREGTIASDNGIALNGLMFATGAFSGVIGALLKVMSGSDVPPSPGTTTVTKSVIASTTDTPIVGTANSEQPPPEVK